MNEKLYYINMARNLLYIFAVCVLCCCAGQSGNSDAVSGGGNEASEVADSVSSQEDDEFDIFDESEPKYPIEKWTSDWEEIREYAILVDSIMKKYDIFDENQNSDYKAHTVIYGYDSDFDSLWMYKDDKLVFEKFCPRVEGHYGIYCFSNLYDLDGKLRMAETADGYLGTRHYINTLSNYDSEGKREEFWMYSFKENCNENENKLKIEINYKNDKSGDSLHVRYSKNDELFIAKFSGNEMIDSTMYLFEGENEEKLVAVKADSLETAMPKFRWRLLKVKNTDDLWNKL